MIFFVLLLETECGHLSEFGLFRLLAVSFLGSQFNLLVVYIPLKPPRCPPLYLKPPGPAGLWYPPSSEGPVKSIAACWKPQTRGTAPAGPKPPGHRGGCPRRPLIPPRAFRGPSMGARWKGCPWTRGRWGWRRPMPRWLGGWYCRCVAPCCCSLTCCWGCWICSWGRAGCETLSWFVTEVMFPGTSLLPGGAASSVIGCS